MRLTWMKKKKPLTVKRIYDEIIHILIQHRQNSLLCRYAYIVGKTVKKNKWKNYHKNHQDSD